MNLSAQQIAAALGGQVNSPSNVTAPGPGHGPSNRNLSVTINPTAPDGFTVNSFAGADWQVCKDYVREKIGIAAFGRTSAPSPIDPARIAEIEADQLAGILLKSAKRVDAARIWKQGQKLQGTIAEQYLKNRLGGADVPEMVIASDQIRFHPKPYFDAAKHGLDAQAGERGIAGSAGALVSRLCDPLTGKATAIHRTFITPGARNVKQRGVSVKRMLGGTGILKLCDPDGLGETMLGLSIGEGLESSMAAMVRYGACPIWATMTAGEMLRFPVLPHVEAISIWCDFDKINPMTGKRTGSAAATECAQRWADADREARVMTPPREGFDFADIQSGEAA